MRIAKSLFLVIVLATGVTHLASAQSAKPESKQASERNVLPAELETLIEAQAEENGERFAIVLRQVFEQQAVHCCESAGVETVTVHEQRDGDSLRIELRSPGRSGFGDRLPDAIVLKGNKIESLSFRAMTAIDDCPCECQVDPEFFNDEWLKKLCEIHTLEEIDLGHTQVTNEGLKHLVYLPNLKTLLLNHSQIDTNGLRHLKHLKILESLHLRKVKNVSLCFESLSDCKNLKALHISNVEVNQEAFRKIKNLNGLDTLELRDAVVAQKASNVATDIEISDKVFPTRLRRLDLTLKGSIGDLKINDLRGLETVSLGLKRDQSKGNVYLSAMPNLSSLQLSIPNGLPKVSGNLPKLLKLSVQRDLPADEFANLPSQFPNLEVLRLHGWSYKKPVDLEHLQPLKSLAKLKSLHSPFVRLEDGLELIDEMKQLNSVLMYVDTATANPQVKFSHPNLKSVSIQSLHVPKIATEDVADVGKGKPGPFEVTVSNCRNLEQFVWMPYATHIIFINTPKLKGGNFQYDQGPLDVDLSQSGMAHEPNAIDEFGMWFSDKIRFIKPK